MGKGTSGSSAHVGERIGRAMVEGAGELSGNLCGPSGRQQASKMAGNARSNNTGKTPSGSVKGMKTTRNGDNDM